MQATVIYAVIGLGVVLAYLVGVPTTSVADGAGVVWQRTSLAEGTATVAIYTMLFATAQRVAAPVLNNAAVLEPYPADSRDRATETVAGP